MFHKNFKTGTAVKPLEYQVLLDGTWTEPKSYNVEFGGAHWGKKQKATTSWFIKLAQGKSGHFSEVLKDETKWGTPFQFYHLSGKILKYQEIIVKTKL